MGADSNYRSECPVQKVYTGFYLLSRFLSLRPPSTPDDACFQGPRSQGGILSPPR